MGVRSDRVPSAARTRALVVLTLLVTGFSLRTAVTSVSPVLADIQAEEGLTGAAAAMLTTLPVVCFGLGAFGAARLGRRFGMETVLAGSMVVLAVGVAVRLAPGPVALFGGTVVAGAGIALANVLIPAAVKRDAPPAAVGAVLGASTLMISVGAATAAAVTVPVQTALGTSWRGALAVWVVPVALAVLLWVPLVVRARRNRVGACRDGEVGGGADVVGAPSATGPAGPARSAAVATRRRGAAVPGLRRRALAWQVTLLMGLQSLHFFAMAAWVPTVFVDRGFTPQQGGLLLAVSGFAAVPANYLAPVLAARSRTQHHLVAAMVVLMAASYVGILTAPGLGVLWMVCAGLGQGTGLSLSHALMALRTRTAAETSELSGMAQGVGYCLAALGPVGLGLLYDASGDWVVPMLALLLLLVPLAVAGGGAARDRLLTGPDGPAAG